MGKLKSFFQNLQQHVGDLQPGSQSTAPPTSPAPSTLTQGFPNQQDFYRFRKQRGVNLGSWFVLERWITDHPFRFAKDPGQSDHDVARGPQAKYVFEMHWDEWIKEEDWKWIADRGFNTVRIPIAFYHLCTIDPSVLVGTDFAGLGYVFEGAWARITLAIASAHQHGIGVLIDLHAAPGKQNADAHSGTSSSDVAFFGSAHMAHTTHILTSLLTHLLNFTRTHNPPLPNLVGIELLNEPNPPNGDHASLQKWYRTTIAALRKIDPDMPLYIGDSWRTDEYAGCMGSLGAQPSPSAASFLALDHHLYRCFTQGDISTSAAQHAQALRDPGAPTPSTFARVASNLTAGGAGLVVGEWSGALNPGSLQGVQDERSAKRDFVDAQLALYETHCAGSFWWTYKKQHPGDSGWALRDAVAAMVFPPFIGLKPRGPYIQGDEGVEARKLQARDGALAAHSGYWNQYPGKYEHWRFGEGYVRGWDDAYMFLSFTPTSGGAHSEIGFKGAWAKRRVAEHASEKGNTNLWEYEHGIMQGIDGARIDFTQVYG